MPSYRAYGLFIASDIDLPGLDAAALPASGPDVRIREREIDVEDYRRGHDHEQHIVASFQDMLLFSVSNGSEIDYCWLTPDVPDEVLTSRLLGEIMAGLLRQRGMLVVHACAVEKDGAAVAFFGESGWGKSTLAAFLCQHGYRLLTDDVMALTDGRVVPSYPQIRLRTDSADHFRANTRLDAIERNGPKWAQNSVPMADAPVPLRALFLLEPTYRARAALAPVPASEALMALVMHTRAKTLVNTNAPGLLRAHLAQCADLVRTVPPWQLERRRSLDALGEIQALIERHVAERQKADRAGVTP